MENQEIKKLIFNFIRKHKIAAISTISKEGGPCGAIVGFGETSELELIFETFSTYRKYANIQFNNRVAFVIGWEENITVQYEGEAYELNGIEAEKYKEIYWEKNPKARRWSTKPEIRFFKVIPKWIRYSDLNVNPWKIYEVKL